MTTTEPTPADEGWPQVTPIDPDGNLLWDRTRPADPGEYPMMEFPMLEGGTLDVGLWYKLPSRWHPWRRREARRAALARWVELIEGWAAR